MNDLDLMLEDRVAIGKWLRAQACGRYEDFTVALRRVRLVRKDVVELLPGGKYYTEVIQVAHALRRQGYHLSLRWDKVGCFGWEGKYVKRY